MKMGIQTAQEACVDSLERPRPGCSAHKATPLQLYCILKPSEKLIILKKSTYAIIHLNCGGFFAHHLTHIAHHIQLMLILPGM